MACRRSITARAKLLYREQKLSPAFSHINNHPNDDDIKNPSKTPDTKFPKIPAFLQSTSSFSPFSCSRSSCNHQGFSFTPTHQFMHSMNFGSNFSRNMSTGAGDGAAVVGDSAADVLIDTASTAAEAASTAFAPVMSEVAVAAADSFFPVAVLQYMIGYIHTFTGLNWWGAIIVSTLVIRLATCFLVLSQLKAISRFTLIRPSIEAIKKEMDRMDANPKAVAEGQERMKKIFKEYGVSPLTPWRGVFIQAPIFVCFYFAISRMVAKVPSFSEGGAFWFTDLTRPDSMGILPALAALTFYLSVELNTPEKTGAKRIIGQSVGFAILSLAFTLTFPQGLFLYWITSSLFSLIFGKVTKIQSIRMALGIPNLPTVKQKPQFSLFQAVKRYADAQVQAQAQTKQPQSSSSAASQLAGTLPPLISLSQAVPSSSSLWSSSSSSVFSQKIKNLENEIKGIKKGKKEKDSLI